MNGVPARASRVAADRPLGLLILIGGGVGAIGYVMLTLQHRGAMLPLLALAGLVLGVLILIRPATGLLAVVLAAALVRVGLSTGTESTVVASLACACLLCAVWPIHRVLNRQRLNLLPRALAVPALALMASSIFSLLYGRLTLDPRVSYYDAFLKVQLAATALVLVSAGLLFVGGDLLRQRQLRNWLTAIVIGVGFWALPFRALGLDAPLVGRSVFGLFGLWFVALCWAHGLANRRLPMALRLTLIAGALGWLGVQFVLQREWISGWTPPAIAIIGITLIARPRLGILLAVVGGLLLFGVSDAVHTFTQQILVTQEQEGSLGGDFGRFELWLRSLEVLQGHIMFGTGPAGYALYYVTFIPDQAMSTHSNYIDVLAEMGVPGLASFVALLIGVGWTAARSLRAAAFPDDRATCAAILGALPALAYATSLGDWVIPFVYNQTIAGFDHSVYTWLMFAMIGGLAAERKHGVSDGA